MSKTRYEWTLLDFAIWTAGAVTVPIYETSSAEQVQWILSDSGAVACIVESAGAPSPSSTSVRGDARRPRAVWSIDDGGVDDLAAAGTRVDRRGPRGRGVPRRSADDLATIIYTSGTTGRPKGCELTHGNFLFEAANVISAKDADATLSNVFQDENASTLLFLPLAHVFARMIEVGVVMAAWPSSGTPPTSRT